MTKEETPETRQHFRDAIAEARQQAAEWRRASDQLGAGTRHHRTGDNRHGRGDPARVTM